MITFKFLRFTFAVYVSHAVNVLVVLNITSQEHLTYRFDIMRTLQPRGTCKETTRNVFRLKLYCRFEYTKPCMINRIWGLNNYDFR